MNINNYTQFICHRKPERSFFFRGHQFPVCSRCTGFYISLVAYFIYTYYNFVNYNISLLILAFLLLIPTIIDGLTQFFDFQESNNTRRFLTGLLGGLGLGIILKAIKWFIFLLIIKGV